MAGKRRAEGTASSGPANTSRSKTVKTSKDGSPREPRTRKQWVLFGLKWAGITFLVFALLAVGGFIYLYNAIDIPDANSDFETQTTKVYYSNGEDLGKFAIQDRDIISYEEMPQNIKDAVVAAENRSFWTDNGVDVKGILRAAFNNAAGGTTEGASTITQQLVKILYLTQDQSYTRKVKEAILALKIQRQLSKKEVLTDYLNTIYFGRGAYGVEAASQAYFNKPAKRLKLREAAMLASVLNDPNQLDPKNGPDSREALLGRYRYTLGSMADIGTITADQAEKAEKRLPKLPKQEAEDTYGGQRGFMLSMVREQLHELGFEDDEIDGGGLRVTTTFTDKDMKAAEDGVLAGKPEGFGDTFLHIGAAIVEPGTGAVRGFYAGQDYLKSQLNWAVRGGMAGSTFKPFALATALKQGFALDSTFEGNSPIEVGDASFRNEGDNDYGSRVSLLKATEESINTAYIDLSESLDDGPESIVETANAMGIPPIHAPKKGAWGFPDASPGLEANTQVTLGSATISPINMANAYATIANGGVAAEPFIIDKVTGPDGKPLYEHDVVTHKAMDEDKASDVSYALQQVVEQGTGTAALDLDWPAAGKTGTATNGLDQVSSAWFAGYTPQLATAVMYVRGKGVGQLDGWLPSYFGGTYPAQSWTEIMSRAMEGLPVEQFPEPALLDETDPPDDDHAPYTPPPPPKTTKKTEETSEPPTSEPPTSEPPTSEPPTSEPPTSEPPTTSESCFLNPNDCPTDESPGDGNAFGRGVMVARETEIMGVSRA